MHTFRHIVKKKEHKGGEVQLTTVAEIFVTSIVRTGHVGLLLTNGKTDVQLPKQKKTKSRS